MLWFRGGDVSGWASSYLCLLLSLVDSIVISQTGGSSRGSLLDETCGALILAGGIVGQPRYCQIRLTAISASQTPMLAVWFTRASSLLEQSATNV
ncbi:hypothetical protein Tco_0248219 [Tanacetum coccineum]